MTATTLSPELRELADQLHEELENAPPDQLHAFFQELAGRQTESASAPNHVKYLLGQLSNLFYEQMKAPPSD